MNRICIIGGANIDLCGASLQPLRSYDSNPGTIAVSFGGVGRNIAQICALLKQHVRFVSCFSDDPYGRQMKADCEQLGMDCSRSLVLADWPSSMYIAILDHNRDMKIAMSDMRILSAMDEAMIDRAICDLTPQDVLVVDGNLSANILRYILQHAPCPTAADPVSASKIGKLKPLLNRISIFKPNQYESQELTGIWIKDDETARQSLNWFRDRGVQEIIISMADRGLLLASQEGSWWLTHRTISLENATGGGDSFMGAYLARRVSGEPPLAAAEYAVSAAVITIETNAVKRRSLNDEEIRQQMDQMMIKERKL